MLDKNYKCEECSKPNCKQLEWSKIKKMWICFLCRDKEIKNDNKK